MSDVQLDLELLKVNCEEEFHSWFNEIKSFADKFDISVCTPRIVTRQVYRSNVIADGPEDYYRRNIMIPFLDHITSEMESRFGAIHQTIIKLLCLVPSAVVNCSFQSIEGVARPIIQG